MLSCSSSSICSLSILGKDDDETRATYSVHPECSQHIVFARYTAQGLTGKLNSL